MRILLNAYPIAALNKRYQFIILSNFSQNELNFYLTLIIASIKETNEVNGILIFARVKSPYKASH